MIGRDNVSLGGTCTAIIFYQGSEFRHEISGAAPKTDNQTNALPTEPIVTKLQTWDCEFTLCYKLLKQRKCDRSSC